MKYLKEVSDLLEELLSTKRFHHCIRTGFKAHQLATIHSKNEEFITKAFIAGALHDIAKEFPFDELVELLGEDINDLEIEYQTPQFMHSIAGAKYITKHIHKFKSIEKYIDEDFLNSIKYHTVGNYNMTLLMKIVYLADKIENARDYIGVNEIREVANYDLDKAILLELNYKIKMLIDKNVLIHHNAFFIRNDLIKGNK